MHLAAESHVERSIPGPGVFIAGNVTGTYNLLQAGRENHESLNEERQTKFRLHHISTDEVLGSLGAEGRFSETIPMTRVAPIPAERPATAW